MKQLHLLITRIQSILSYVRLLVLVLLICKWLMTPLAQAQVMHEVISLKLVFRRNFLSVSLSENFFGILISTRLAPVMTRPTLVTTQAASTSRASQLQYSSVREIVRHKHLFYVLVIQSLSYYKEMSRQTVYLHILHNQLW